MIGNVKGPKGDKGDTGATGAQGPAGAQGKTGATGATGPTGQRGSRWTTGTEIIGTSVTATIFSNSGISDALVNDMYLNTSTGNTYRCTTAGAASVAKWVYAGNIKGPTGATGATGAQGPAGAKGDKGDFDTADTTFIEAMTLKKLTSGEAFKTMLGKIAKAVTDLISHVSTTASTSVLGHVKFGTASGTACQGNDSRLSDTRTPKSHAATTTTYGAGTTSNYGHVKLSDSSAVTNSTGLALPATEKNANIEGTLANQISKLNTNLTNHKTSSEHDDRYYTKTEVDSKLAQKSKLTVQAQILTGNGGNWILVSNSSKKLITAQTVRDDTSFYVTGINKQSATGVYTLIFNENIEKGSNLLVWLTWID